MGLPLSNPRVSWRLRRNIRHGRSPLWPLVTVPVITLLLLSITVDVVAPCNPESNADETTDIAAAIEDSTAHVDDMRKGPVLKQESIQSQEPEVESLLADFDNDGHVGRLEIQQIKDKLHDHLDTDDSGGLDVFELQKNAQSDQDVDAALKKLDSDNDDIVSWKELDERWESVGAEMTVDEVADWVAYAVQLPQYSEIFRANSISGYTFPLLMANDGARMQEIGVQRELHRHQLAMFLQMKYLGMGRKPKAVASSVCTTGDTLIAQENVVLQIAWVPAEDSPQRYQLQRRSPGESTWKLVFFGADTEVTDVVEYDCYTVYRLTTWNSYGRSPRTYIHCDDAATSSVALPDVSTFDSSRPLLSSTGKSQSVHPLSSQGRHNRKLVEETSHMENTKHVDSDDGCDHRISTWSLLKIYFWWLDDAIIILLVVMLPIRGIIYGDADLLLRLLRRLPPNMPTRVTVEMESTQATVENAVARISWEKPVDNGVPIICYTVRWTRTKTGDEQCTRLLAVPLPTTVMVEKLSHGETYKFVVQATNQFGLVTSSSRSTYMVPIPEIKGKLRPQHLSAEGRAVCNQCHVCHDPRYKKKVPFTATLDRRILHYCCSCGKEFCHYHKGEVHHSKAVSCPIVDGRCVCITCNERRLRRTVTN